MRVLVLGGAGFIGRHLLPALQEAGHEVVAPTRTGPGALDATDTEALAATARTARPDAVVNLLGAGLARGTADPAAMTAVNSALPATLAAILADLPRPPLLVHAASSTERVDAQGGHESDYSRTKWEGTQALVGVASSRGLPTTIARIHNTYGPDQPAARFVMSVIRSLGSGEPVTLHHPERVRDFVLVDDVAASLVRAVEAGDRGVWHSEIGTGTGLSLRDAAVVIAHALDQPESLVRDAGTEAPDANPVTVCPVPHGTFGTCTTTFEDGITRTVRDM